MNFPADTLTHTYADSPEESSIYKYLATMDAARVLGRVRLPGPLWSGYGFSHTHERDFHMATATQTAVKAAAIAEREELCSTFGFRNRWTAMIYQWATDEFGLIDYTLPLDEAAENVREWALTRVPEDRLWNVDFTAIAGALQCHDEAQNG